MSSSDPFVANHLQQEMSSAKLSHFTDVTSRSLVQCQERERLEHCLLATRGELESVREELGAKSERLLASLTKCVVLEERWGCIICCLFFPSKQESFGMFLQCVGLIFCDDLRWLHFLLLGS